MIAVRSIRLGAFLAVALTAAPGPAPAQSCDAPGAWFPHASTPEPGNVLAGDTPCDFHRWSWQTFLRMTQTVDNSLRFLKETRSPAQVFGTTFLKRGGGSLPAWQDLKPAPLRLRPRDTKQKSTRGIDEIEQAGNHGVLVDQNARAVYFAIHLNQVYYDFIRSRGYNNPEALKAAPPTAKFPPGTVELKSSWRVVLDGEDTTGLYTTDADVEWLKTEDGHVVVDPGHFRRKRVALVGLHIAGVVNGHDEFIWSTFEHNKNAPPLPPRMKVDSADPVSNDAGWTFYKAGTPANACNHSNAGVLKLTDPAAQTLDPVTQVFREYPGGGGDDADVIRALNDSVHKKLGTEVWAGYDLIGSLWSGDTAIYPGVPIGNQKGSVKLSNTTMETFRQSFGNCFTCHNTQRFEDEGFSLGPKNLNLSHALRGAFIRNSQFAFRDSLKALKAPPKE